MGERIKAWVKKHRKGLCITLIISAAGVATILINGKKVNLSLGEFFSKQCRGNTQASIPPIVAEAVQRAIVEAPAAGEPIVLDVEYQTITFPRSEHIRRLSGGRKASAAKLLQAAEEGVELLPGETLVNKCMVSRRVA